MFVDLSYPASPPTAGPKSSPAPASRHFSHYESVLALYDSFVSDVELQAEKCGYDKFLNEALTLSPPKGVKFPSVPNPKREGCVVEDEIACAPIPGGCSAG
ncbi:uncharacterized protein ATNIH1004_007611 [Aspergillus tanneri]|uniref:Uncharacterized protein n=1 Tax=Aspergillus tanneri TaxID=1220188 RepID=A0A5M9MGS5_9EURO|nr:uncharacterized protein ATNIH1004_007611 [Aspergillus tanneri]KAA8646185.1 hypothetical protein ATNIH1004_007611 [Aspergillus tanneri]